MLDRPPTQDVVTSSAIPKGYICVSNFDVRLNIYKDPILGVHPASEEGLTALMTTLNLVKYSGETGEDVFGSLTAATAQLRVAQIPAKFWVNDTSSAFTGANNAWFTSWSAKP